MSGFHLVKSLRQAARLSRARVCHWRNPLGRKTSAEFHRNVAAEASKALDVTPEVALEKSSDCAFLDVRTPEEFAAGHAPGAINIPVMLRGEEGMAPNPTFMEAVAKQFPGKETPLLVSCKAGSRSVAACEMLTGAGYSQLSNVVGGYDAWSAAGLPSEA